MPSGTRSRAGSGFWKMQPALADSSGCVRLRNASDSRATARSASGLPWPTRKSADEHDLAACDAGGCSRSRTPSRRPARPDAPAAVDRACALVDQLADQPPLKVRVAVDRAADRARRSGPGLEAGDAAVDRPAHQAVDRDAGIGADARLVQPPRPRRRGSGSPVRAARRRRQHVRAAAEHRHRQTGIARDGSSDASDLVARIEPATSQSAGPPTLKVVNGASGASRWTRSAPNASRSDDSTRRSSNRIRAPGASRRPLRSAAMRLDARARRELDPVARRELAGERQVGGDHGRDLRIPAGRLSIGHQQDRLARGGHLERTERRRVRQDVGGPRMRERGPSSR